MEVTYMKKILKLLSGLLSIAMLIGSLTFVACSKTDEKPIDENEKPIVEEPVIPLEELIYNDEKFNQAGFVKAFNEVLDVEMKAQPETYDHFLNNFYGEYDPLWIYYDKRAKVIKLASFAKYKFEIVGGDHELWSGEFRLVSFPIDIDACKTWSEFKEKFVEEVMPEDINYELFVKYEHEIGSDKYMANKEMYDSSIKLSKILYQQIYDDYVPADTDLFFFGMPYEINNGDRMLLPIGTLFFNDKNQVEFIGSEIWVSTEGGWENKMNCQTKCNT